MSSKICTFHCFFEKSDGISVVQQWLTAIEEGAGYHVDEILKQHGLKPVFNETEESSLEYAQINDGYVEFQSQIYTTEKDTRGFIQLIAAQGARFIIADIYDDQVDEGKTYYYEAGLKTTQKNIKAQLKSLPSDLRFALASSLTPENLPKYIAELGGYNAKVFGKPIFFYMAAQPDAFNHLIDEMFKVADLNAIDESSGDNVIHHICRRESLEPEILIRLIKSGVSATAVNKRGEKPIHAGIKTLGFWSHSDRSEVLIKHGGESPNTLFPNGMPFLYIYLQKFGVGDDFMRLLKQGGDINYQSPEGTAAWIARKFDPKGAAKLSALGATSNKGENTYINSSLIDIKTSIEFMDNEVFNKILKALELQITEREIKELFYLCLEYGYLHGFSTLEEKFTVRITAGDIPRPHNKNYPEETAYNYCAKFSSCRRNAQDYFAITRKLIKNSSQDELETILNVFNWNWLVHNHENEFIEQLELLKSKGVELRMLVLKYFPRMKQQHFQGERINNKYNNYLRKLIALDIDLSIIMNSYEEEKYFTNDNRDILDTLMRRGQTRVIKKYIRANYRNNNKMLLDFLLSTDLANLSVQALIWDTLLSSMGFDEDTRHCKFSADFLDPLVAAGLPLNNAYKACSSPHFWTPYLNAGYSDAPSGYREYLEAKGVTEKLSEEARATAKINPPRNYI